MMGDDAVLSIASRAVRRAADLFTHDKPSDLAFNPNGDMTKLAGPAVAQAFQYFTGMHAFLACELGKLDAEQTVQEFQVKIVKQRIILGSADSKSKKYNIDAHISLDEEHLRLSKNLLEKTAYRAALEATVKGLENKAACLSRELTRREYESRLNQRSGG